jgi:heterodisulfide reductase subunit A
MTSALSLAEQASRCISSRRGRASGATSQHLRHIDVIDVQELLRATVERVTRHGHIHLHTDSEIIASEGSRGSFLTEIMTAGLSEPEEIRHGVAILATGASESRPRGQYLFGEDERVITQLDLEKALNDMSLPALGSAS